MAIGTLAAALIGGGLLGSAALSSSASKKAGSTVAGATDRAADLQNEQFNKLLALQMPAYNRGEQAAGLYMSALGFPSMTGPTNGYASAPSPTASMMTGGAAGSYTGGHIPRTAPSRQMADGGYATTMEGGPAYMDASQLGGGSYTGPGGQVPAPITTGGGSVPAPQQTPIGQQDIAGLVKATPGYQAQLDQGLKAIDRAAPLVGGMYSGRRMKALNDYGQNTFGSYYQDWLNRVGGVAGQGQQTAQNVGQAGMQNAANVGGLMVQGANARAQGSLNSANAWSGAIGTGVGLYGGAQGWF